MIAATWTLPDFFAGPPNAKAATALLEDYFARYSGRRFERMFGGGDAPGRQDVVTAEDLVAVTMLKVSIGDHAAIAVLETHAAAITAHLAGVRSDVELADAGGDVIGPESPAWQLWKLLRSTSVPGVGRTKASKLMARKRPHLIPVQDEIVSKELGHAEKDDYWASLHSYLNGHRCGGGLPLKDWLRDARDASGIGGDISVIRVFDVLVWMHARRPHRG